MGIMDGNPKKDPLHYGEVIGLWAFMGANNGLISGYEAFVNHAGDKDLMGILEESIQLMKSEVKEVAKGIKSKRDCFASNFT